MPLRRAFSAFFNTVADALFPIHPAEREALAMDKDSLFKCLPRATDAPIPEACSIFHYKDERVFHLIWSIKYKKSLKGASLAAHALFRILKQFQSVIPEDMRILIVSMPITKSRRREREPIRRRFAAALAQRHRGVDQRAERRGGYHKVNGEPLLSDLGAPAQARRHHPPPNDRLQREQTSRD